MSENSELSNYFNEHLDACQMFLANNDLLKVTECIVQALKRGNRIYAFGNGGSAADASHFVAELVGRFEVERMPYNAVCLNCDVSVMTALANDYGYENVFSRQVKALVKPSDVVIGFSTSGSSPNVIAGILVANIIGAYTIGFTGDNKHGLRDMCNYNVVVPSKRTCIIQEIHQLAIHYIAGQVEKELK
jgi:D-sedoheptulose 7-phosphate isomerase